MGTVQAHYDTLLARYYSWLWGGFEAKAADNCAFFSSRDITPGQNGRAVDLGCGSGFQSIPLAEAGFSVTAIDLSQDLLDELTRHGHELDITPVQGDILSMASHCPEPIELAVCMGDTLTHLPTADDVRNVFQTVFQTLESGGMFIITYRDLSYELTGLDRFIPVRSDDTTIFNCFLEYQEDNVIVHDIINRRTEEGWVMEKSSYAKLRLPVDHVVENLEQVGFAIKEKEINMGLVTLRAVKP